ncbi:hypothetical protein [Arthrobacter sp. GMC3]|uniref:hypothetical protein n=1 Tax=Arthrobacter sp. GMC3 TaxID=2058894 RepID=UPI00215707DD|nr:hypothetical protein [Arthrobacter sp. GMC3]
MTSSTFQRLHQPGAVLSRRAYRPAATALAAILLLSGCSGAPSPTPSTTSSPVTTQSSTASAPPSTASATPTAESAVKELVAGFPTQLIPLMPGATVTSSSLQRSTPLSSAALTATITATSADVLTYYTKVFTDQGFTAQPGDAVDGLPLKTFVRADGQEIVTVSVVQSGETATATIGANVLPASLK